jgi:hypothetical protein
METVRIPLSLQSVTGLGEPVRAYPRNAFRKAWSIVVCVAWAVLGLALGFYGLAIYPRAGPQQVTGLDVPLILGLAGLLLLAALVRSWRTASRWDEAALVYRDGFAYFNGRQVRAYKWQDINAVMIDVARRRYLAVIPGGTRHRYGIVGVAGKVQLDDGLSRVEDLFDRIRDGSFPHILRRSRRAFQAGVSVDFGPISISRRLGVQIRWKKYAWDEIARISATNGALEITPKKDGLFSRRRIAIARIPNLDAFLVIAADAAPGRVGAG